MVVYVHIPITAASYGGGYLSCLASEWSEREPLRGQGVADCLCGGQIHRLVKPLLENGVDVDAYGGYVT